MDFKNSEKMRYQSSEKHNKCSHSVETEHHPTIHSPVCNTLSHIISVSSYQWAAGMMTHSNMTLPGHDPSGYIDCVQSAFQLQTRELWRFPLSGERWRGSSRHSSEERTDSNVLTNSENEAIIGERRIDSILRRSLETSI